MVQIYNKITRNKHSHPQVLKTKIGRNSLSYTLFYYLLL